MEGPGLQACMEGPAAAAGLDSRPASEQTAEELAPGRDTPPPQENHRRGITGEAGVSLHLYSVFHTLYSRKNSL